MQNDESIGIPDAMSAAAEDLELTQTSRESDQILKSDVEIACQNKDISSKFFTERLKEKVESGEPLSDEEQMEFCIFPLTYRKKEEKAERIREAVKLAARIVDREQQIFVLAGIMTFTDKVIDEETADQIRKVIKMTKIGLLFEKEKEEAVMEERRKTEEERKKKEEAEKRLKEERKKAEKRSEEERRKILKEQTEERKKSAIEMLRDELPVAKIARYSGLDMATVTELAQSIS